MNFKLLLFLVGATTLFNLNPIEAQIVKDKTLSTEVTEADRGDFQVRGGEQRGNNLFHSFAEFSLANGDSVLFDNALTIQNIISRVTGNSVSQIDGLIQSNGTANLFLINPNGIVFGENASLNIGGSFVGTTAESLLFEDGIEFSADLDNSESLLTISTPLGLQFGSNAGQINNQANFSVANPLDPRESQSKLGLVAAAERTFALVGNGITFDGGAISVPSGNIELGSVAENSFVFLKPFSEGWKVDYGNVSQFRDIQLNDLASVDASGEGGGSINVTGRDIQILDGSAISSNTLGSLDGESINIKASNLVEINGSDNTGTQIDPFLAGFEIFLPSASNVSSNTLGTGNSGNINITAKNLQLIDGAKIELQTLPTGTGNGGNLAIVADDIILQGARPLLGVGENAANLVLPEIGLDAAIELNQSSQISAVSLNSGNVADIGITAQNLRIEGGSLIAVSPFATGDGGNINLTLSESLQITGVSPRTGSVSSQITANTFANGNAGNINIKTEQLQIADGGLLLSTTASTGNSGNILIDADSVKISGIRQLDRISSSISTQTQDEGGGGNIELNTNSLTISDRASLSVQGSGSGVPGNLIVNANSVELRSASITAATEFQSGGNIELNIEDRLTLRENSLISARAFNDASGGNLSIDANFIVAFPQENNDILANALFGSGGNITINAEGIFGLEERNSKPPNLTNDFDASSEFGTAGIVSISFPTISKVEGELETPSDELDVESLFKNSFCKVRDKSSFAVIGRGGIARIPDDTIPPEHTWSDWRIVETRVSPRKVEPVEKTTVPKKLSMIRGWVTDTQGNIVLTDRPNAVAATQPGFKTPDCNQINQESSN